MAKMKERFPELTDHEYISESAVETIETATPSDVEEIHFPSSPAARAALMLGTSRLCMLAVENRSGYLVPVFTGADLLFELKRIWRAKL
jgi:hypothetical protein